MLKHQRRLSRLETIPSDVLQHIAFLAASLSCSCTDARANIGALLQCDCPLAPTALYCLLQTSSVIYRQLSLTAMPALYADLFCAMFDTQALARRYTMSTSQPRVCLTSSALAVEFVNRCRLLRRIRRQDMSPRRLMQDLWTAMWMVLESDGTNEVHLGVSGFSRFIITLACSHLDPCLHPHLRNRSMESGHCRQSHLHSDMYSLDTLIIWLLCLSIHKDVILDMPKHDRDILVCCIFPFMFGTDKANTKTPSLVREAQREGPERSQRTLNGVTHQLKPPAMSVLDGHESHDTVNVYGVQSQPFAPDPYSAAIQLVFALEEASISLQVPPHLPETRAVADATFRTGPTREDFAVFASYRTPLHSDTLLQRGAEYPCVAPYHASSRSARHNGQFRGVLDILRHSRNRGSAMRFSAPLESVPFQYIPGSMAGRWEGIYKNYVNIPGIATEAVIKPLEFCLSEFIHPVSNESQVSEDHIDLWGCLPPEVFHLKRDCTSLLIGKKKYQRFIQVAAQLPQFEDIRYDVILLGETSDTFSRAWGKSYFFGRVHSDGGITLRCHLKAMGGNYVLRGHLQSEIGITGHLTIGLPTQGGSMAAQSAFSVGRVSECS